MYNEIAIYRPVREIKIKEKPSGRSKTVETIRVGCKIYIDKTTRNWGRICFIRNDYQADGDLIHNGYWIEIDSNLVIVWAKGREINKRQQENL